MNRLLAPLTRKILFCLLLIAVGIFVARLWVSFAGTEYLTAIIVVVSMGAGYAFTALSKNAPK